MFKDKLIQKWLFETDGEQLLISRIILHQKRSNARSFVQDLPKDP
jgi:hypothetical protein